jgi:peroxiredoxin
MIQAEIGAASCNAEGQLPRKGLRIRDFELWGRDGKVVRLSDFRDHYNLVLLFLGTPDEKILAFAKAIADRAAEFEEHDARVLMAFTVPTKRLTRIPGSEQVLVLTDIDGKTHEAVGATGGAKWPAQACYITDRFAEVFAAFRTKDGNVMPSVDDLIGWLDFVEAQCPECEAPEWPADEA